MLYIMVIAGLIANRFQNMMYGKYDVISYYSRYFDKHSDSDLYDGTLEKMGFSSNFSLESKNADGLDSFKRYNLLTKDNKFNTEEFEKYFQIGAAVYVKSSIIWYPMVPQEIQLNFNFASIDFTLSPEFIQDAQFNPEDIVQNPKIMVAKCFKTEMCKSASEVKQFMDDFSLEFEVYGFYPSFVKNQDYLYYDNKFIQSVTIFLENTFTSYHVNF